MKKFLLVLLMFSATSQAGAQLQGRPRIDSMLAQLPKSKEDTNKVMLLNDLSLAYYSINPDEGLKFGKQGLALAEKLNWKKGTAYAYKVIAGNYGYGKSDYPQALEYSFKSLQQFTETGDKMGTAKILGDIGVVYWFQSDYPKALKYYFDALRLNEEQGIKNEIAATLCNIGIVYNSQGDYPKALDYMLKANKIDEELGNKSGVAANLGNIGELYVNVSDTIKAVEYNSKAVQLNQELGDKNGMARNLASLGTIYVSKREYSKGLDYYFQALNLTRELGNKSALAIILGNIGNTYSTMVKEDLEGVSRTLQSAALNQQSALRRARVYTDSSINMLREIGELTPLISNYKSLSEIQALLGDHKGALKSFTSYSLLKDSVFNMEKDKKLTETAMQYEFDKREAVTKAEQEKKDLVQRNIRNWFIVGATLMLVLLVALINRYRYKQKANRELAAAYENLKATQQQLVESEKMAAFGVMATRMAHEIQNPLNFVNNFSGISKELVHEILSSHSEDDKKLTANLLVDNLEKINHHGNRAAGIIHQLQDHARAGTAQRFFEEERNNLS
jgi:tetratricopeptide (TPR) repeat protein